jgi:hypothetical protein
MEANVSHAAAYDIETQKQEVMYPYSDSGNIYSDGNLASSSKIGGSKARGGSMEEADVDEGESSLSRADYSTALNDHNHHQHNDDDDEDDDGGEKVHREEDGKAPHSTVPQRRSPSSSSGSAPNSPLLPIDVVLAATATAVTATAVDATTATTAAAAVTAVTDAAASRSDQSRRRFLKRPCAESQQRELLLQKQHEEQAPSPSELGTKVAPDGAEDTQEQIQEREREQWSDTQSIGGDQEQMQQEQMQQEQIQEGQEGGTKPKRRGRPPKRKRFGRDKTEGVAISAAIVDSLSNRQTEPINIAFSGIEPENELVQSISGASVVQDPRLATHLVLGRAEDSGGGKSGKSRRRTSPSKKMQQQRPGSNTPLLRTPKLLLALNTDVMHITCLSWLEDSARAGHALPMSASVAVQSMTGATDSSTAILEAAGDNALKYTVCDAAREKEYSFSMLSNLAAVEARAAVAAATMSSSGSSSSGSSGGGVNATARKGVFSGMAIYVTPGVCGVAAPTSEELEGIVTSGGGVWLGDDSLADFPTAKPEAWSDAIKKARKTGTLLINDCAVVVISTEDALKKKPSLPAWLLRPAGSGKGTHRVLRGRVLSPEFIYVSVLRQQAGLSSRKEAIVRADTETMVLVEAAAPDVVEALSRRSIRNSGSK